MPKKDVIVNLPSFAIQKIERDARGVVLHVYYRKQGYATTLCDLRKHKVFDVILGRASKDVASYFEQLLGKEQVKVVCMDLSNPYRSLVRQYFPKALIVADKFHVVRLINQLCLQTYQQLDPKLKYQRGLLGVLRHKPERLSAKQQPVIAAIADFKQRLHR